jgi:hypothetical protein
VTASSPISYCCSFAHFVSESNDGNFDRSLLYHKVDVWKIYSWDIETVEKGGLREAFYTWSDPLNQDM